MSRGESDLLIEVQAARLRGELERFATDLMVELRLVETVTKGRPSAEGGEAAITSQTDRGSRAERSDGDR